MFMLIKAHAATKGGTGVGVWRTINGSPVFIQGGKITKGPARLVGSTAKDVEGSKKSAEDRKAELKKKYGDKVSSKSNSGGKSSSSTNKKSDSTKKDSKASSTTTKNTTTKKEPTAMQKLGAKLETENLARVIKSDAKKLGFGHNLSDKEALGLAHLNLNATKIKRAFEKDFKATNQKARDKAGEELDAIFKKVAKESGLSTEKVDNLFDLYNETLIYTKIF